MACQCFGELQEMEPYGDGEPLYDDPRQYDAPAYGPGSGYGGRRASRASGAGGTRQETGWSNASILQEPAGDAER